MEHRSCENCDFSATTSQTIGSAYMECRRFPPVENSGARSGFPLTLTDSWCGEFVRKIDTEGWVQVGLFD